MVQPTARATFFLPAGPFFVFFVFSDRGKGEAAAGAAVTAAAAAAAAFAHSLLHTISVFVVVVWLCRVVVAKTTPGQRVLSTRITFSWISFVRGRGRVTASIWSDRWSLLHCRRGSRFSGWYFWSGFFVIERLSIDKERILKGE